MTLTERIKEKSVELGFDLVGIAPAERARHADEFLRWLSKDYHGHMDWMAREPERRADPRLVSDGAQSVVVVGMTYYVADPPDDLWNDPSRGRIARYAWGKDYHDVLSPKLKKTRHLHQRRS